MFVNLVLKKISKCPFIFICPIGPFYDRLWMEFEQLKVTLHHSSRDQTISLQKLSVGRERHEIDGRLEDVEVVVGTKNEQ